MKSLAYLLGTLMCVSCFGVPAAESAAPGLRIETGGHTAAVRRVLFTPDGKYLVSVGEDKAIRIWSVAEARQIRVIPSPSRPGMAGELFAAALHPAGRFLAVGGSDGKQADIRLVDLVTGKTVRTFLGHRESITALTFSSDGLHLASASTDGSVRLWSPESGACRVLTGHSDKAYGLAFSPDGQRLASVGLDARLIVREIGGTKRDWARTCAGPLRTVAWSPDGKTLATGCADRRVYLWNPDTHLESGPPLEQLDAPTCLAFSNDSQLLITGSGENPDVRDWRVRVWSLAEGRVVSRFSQHHSTVICVGLAPGGSLAASGDNAGAIYLWNPLLPERERKATRRLAGLGTGVYVVGWSPDGTRVGWGNEDPRADPSPEGTLEHSFNGESGVPDYDAPEAVGWTRATTRIDGKWLQLSADRRRVELHDPTGVRKIIDGTAYDPYDPEDEIYCYSFTPSGMVIVGSLFALRLFDVSGDRSPRLVCRFVGHEGAVWAVAISPKSGDYLASAGSDGTVRVWRLPKASMTRFPLTQNPMVSLFQTTTREWVAWTPAGYYDGSLKAARLVQVWAGSDPFPLADYQTRYYRPGLVRRLFLGEPVENAAINGNQREAEAPPRVTFSSPTDRALVEGAVIPVRIRVTSTHRINHAELFINGRLFTGRPISIDARPIEIDGRPIEINGRPIELSGRPIELSARSIPDAHDTDQMLTVDIPAQGLDPTTVLRAEVSDQNGLAAFDEVRIERRAAPPPGKLYILAAGVSRYRNPHFNLANAAGDADEFSALWKPMAPALYRAVEVTKLLDEDATAAGIRETLGFIAAKAGPDDTVIVYLSGHGVQPDEGAFYFATHDIDPATRETLAATALSGESLSAALGRMQVRRIVLFIDACHAGSAPGAHPLNMDWLSQMLALKSGVLVIASSRPGQLSYDCGQYPHGAFTQAILEAIGQGRARGATGEHIDRTITAVSLANFVTGRVAELSGGRQSPSIPLLADFGDPVFALSPAP